MKPTPTVIRLILVALAFVTTCRLLPGHEIRATEIQPLDLAAMVLTPDDLERHGLAGYGTDYGQYLTARDHAAGFAREQEMAFEDAIEIFEDMGLSRSYSVQLALPIVGGDYYSDATEGIKVGIYEYDSDASAGSIFDLTQQKIDDGERVVVEGSKEFGDDWVISRSDADDPESGDPARDVSLEFRVGNVTAVLTMFDVARDDESSQPVEPDIDIVEQLGEEFLKRIETADSSEQALLGIEALRLTDESGAVVTVGDRYHAMDGSPIRRFAESDESIETRTDTMAEDRMVTIYGLEQDVRSGGRENPADPHLAVRLIQFEDESAAAEWLGDDAFDRFEKEAYAQELNPIDLPFDLGNASIGATYVAEYGGVDLIGTVVWVQVNDLAVRISLEGAEAFELDVVETLVEAQVDCMLGSPCEPLEVPTQLT